MLFRVFRGYTRVHKIKANHDWRFNDLVFKGLQDILKSCWKVKSYENRKLKGSTLCGISEFEENEKKCAYFVHNCLQFLQLYSFTYTTYKPSHRSHTIIPLSNHHTIIILKSHIFRNIYIIKQVKSGIVMEWEGSAFVRRSGFSVFENSLLSLLFCKKKRPEAKRRFFLFFSALRSDRLNVRSEPQMIWKRRENFIVFSSSSPQTS